MKTISSLMRHLYLKRVSIFLIAVTLIVGTVGCEAAGDEVGPLDHFKWYLADSTESIDEVVYLEDQFCAIEATVGSVVGFGNPTRKVHGEVTTPVSNPDHHLTGYEIYYEEEPETWFVEVENQFGLQELTVWGPYGLAVPTQKEGHQSPVGLDHFLVYTVIDGPSVDVSVSLQDQFDDEPQESGVYAPMYFANPVKKTHGSEVTEILNPEDHLVFYYIDAEFEGEVDVVNQFGEQTLDVYTIFETGGLAVPSEKIDYWQESVYDLTMTVNPAGGGTATDLTNASPYAAGTGVSIQAVANSGYEFADWTAPAGAFTDANAAETTFTMPAQDVTVTANFAESLSISTWYDLDDVRNHLDGAYILINDLNSATAGYTELASETANGGKGWQPIGSPEVDPFTGTFDGQGYEIRDLFIDRPDEYGVGLFGAVHSTGALMNLGVVDADVTGLQWVGGLVGYNEGDVSYSYATGSVSGSEGSASVGGLVGWIVGDVTYCDATCAVTGGAGGNFTGGLAGAVGGTYEGTDYYGSVSDCYATGTVAGDGFVGGLVGVVGGFGDTGSFVSDSYATGDVDGNDYVGGLVGANWYATVDSSYATGSVDGSYSVGGLLGGETGGIVSNCHYATGTVTGDHAVGGLIGGSRGCTVSDSYSTGNVIGSSGGRSVGGLVGGINATASATVSNCYATGTVTGGVVGNWTGGLVGAMGGTAGVTVSNCYATGAVTGDFIVGGLVGGNWWGTVSDSYSTGSVTGNSLVGGLLGHNDGGTVSNSFWDTQTSGQGSSAGGTGKNTAQMKDIDTFSGAGWDIFAVASSSTRNTGYIWNIVDDATYPFLSWQPV